MVLVLNIERSRREMGRITSSGELLLHGRTYPWRCKSGCHLADDTKAGRKACGWPEKESR